MHNFGHGPRLHKWLSLGIRSYAPPRARLQLNHMIETRPTAVVNYKMV